MKERDNDSKIIMNFVDNILAAWVITLGGHKDPHCVLQPLKEIKDRLKENKIFSTK